jgi:L-fuconolactonase
VIVDAHHHLWRLERGDYGWITPELAPIRRDFLAADLTPLLVEAGVRLTVLVQAAPSERDTDFMLEVAAATPWVAAVVGWTDLCADDAPKRLQARAGAPEFRGVRPMLQDEADPAWLLDGSADAALDALEALGLSFDALIRANQLPLIAGLAARRPKLAIALDHAAKPPIASGDLSAWRDAIGGLAQHRSVYCKLSGC